MVEKTGGKVKAWRVIRVESSFDPESRMICPSHKIEAPQEKIDYSITFQGKRFKIPRVWASVCPVCPGDHIYLDPTVGEEIYQAMGQSLSRGRQRLLKL